MDLTLMFYVIALLTFAAFLVLKAENRKINSRAIVFLACFAAFLLSLFSAATTDWSLLSETYAILLVFSVLVSFSLMAIAYWTYADAEEIEKLKSYKGVTA